MTVRLTHIDGKLPNLALMKIAHFYKSRGEDVVFTKHVQRDMLEPSYTHVYGSAIFSKSADRVAAFRESFPEAVVGGTWNVLDNTTVEASLGLSTGENFDYSIYPSFEASIGFTQRGCRLKCGFCVVPKKEGKPRSVSTIPEIWRGGTYPKHLHLLDNDFFGQPKPDWEARLQEIRDGGFKVCLNQGINTRMIDDESAAALAAIPYYDDQFKTKRLYTAWDNIGDEGRFFKGVETLGKHGIPPTHLLVYMLVGYDKKETWERVMYRFERMVALGIRPYPMVFGPRDTKLPPGEGRDNLTDKTLNEFQRWAVRRLYTILPFSEYDTGAIRRLAPDQIEMF